MKKIEHLPNEWYIKDSKAVTEWFQKNINKNIYDDDTYRKYFYINKNNIPYKESYEYDSLYLLKLNHPNAIKITENQLFNIPKTKNKKDNKSLLNILKFIEKENAR